MVDPPAQPKMERSNFKRVTPVTSVQKQKSLFHAFLAAFTALVAVTTVIKDDPRPHVTVKVQEKKLSILVDTGATVSIISQSCFDSLPGSESFEQLPMAHGFNVQGIGSPGMKSNGRYMVPFEILGVHTIQPVYVMNKINNHPWISGIDIIRALHLSVTADTVQLCTVLPQLDKGAHAVFALHNPSQAGH